MTTFYVNQESPTSTYEIVHRDTGIVVAIIDPHGELDNRGDFAHRVREALNAAPEGSIL